MPCAGCKYDLFTVIKNTGVQWFTDSQQPFVTSAQFSRAPT